MPPDLDYMFDLDDDQRARVEALARFTIEAESNDETRQQVYDSFLDTFDSESGVDDVYTKLRNDDLAVYILENPERSEEVLGILARESHLDVAVLDARLSHEVKSLRDGAL